MINYKPGNLLDAPVEPLVNTVNTVGVMKKGVAIQFKDAIPDNFKVYLDAERSGSFHLGKVFVVPVNPIGPVKYVINFSTKGHWRYPSRLEWISPGLQELKAQIRENNIKSIALLPLGCGNGGLDWAQVRSLKENEMKDLNVDVLIYEPNANLQEFLKKKKIHLQRVSPQCEQCFCSYCIITMPLENSQANLQRRN
jgi:O-acetyl-ADP-ribose deacetylase (regulator of RNase III)